MDRPETLEAIDKANGDPDGWWLYDVYLNGVVVPNALSARFGPTQTVRHAVPVPKPPREGEPEPPKPTYTVEGPGVHGYLLVRSAPGSVEIRRRPVRVPVVSGLSAEKSVAPPEIVPKKVAAEPPPPMRSLF